MSEEPLKDGTRVQALNKLDPSKWRGTILQSWLAISGDRRYLVELDEHKGVKSRITFLRGGLEVLP